MKRETAEDIAEYFLWLGRQENASVSAHRLHAGVPLTSFHQWANNRALVSADLLARDDGHSVICLLIDWKDNDKWYLVACDSKTHAPLCEIWNEVGEGSQRRLEWKYTPTKRDNKNDKRVAYFQRVMGAAKISLAIPAGNIFHSIRLAEDILGLVDVRIRADELSTRIPETRDAFPEGELVERMHKARERNSAVVRAAKDEAMKRGSLACQVCAFDFGVRYGDLGVGYIEAHHTVPLSELAGATETRVQDLALVCANCHRMLHRRRPWITMDRLSELLTVDK